MFTQLRWLKSSFSKYYYYYIIIQYILNVFQKVDHKEKEDCILYFGLDYISIRLYILRRSYCCWYEEKGSLLDCKRIALTKFALLGVHCTHYRKSMSHCGHIPRFRHIEKIHIRAYKHWTKFEYLIAEGIMTSVRSLQHSEGDVSDPIKCIYSWSASLDEPIYPCPSARPLLRKLVSQF